MGAGEPDLATDAALQPVIAELSAREPILHHPELGTTRADLEAQLAPDFWEIGASGRRYSRQRVIDLVLERYAADEPDEWETSEFHCRHLADETYLLTYTLRQGERVTRRGTVWRRTSAGWQVVFHQGTVVEDA